MSQWLAVTYLADMMEGKFTVSFTDGFNYLHVHGVFILSLDK